MTISSKANKHLDTVKKALEAYPDAATTSEDANYLLQAILGATLAGMEVSNEASVRASQEQGTISRQMYREIRSIQKDLASLLEQQAQANAISTGIYLAVTGQDIPASLNEEILGEEVAL